jgi:hypothetical protein
MTRQFDRKELERERYIEDHSSTNHLKEENQVLKHENEKLKDKVARLKAQLANAKMLLEQYKAN